MTAEMLGRCIAALFFVALETLRKEARLCLDGKRAQGELCREPELEWA